MVQDKEAMAYLALAWDYIDWINAKYPKIYDEYVKEMEDKI